MRKKLQQNSKTYISVSAEDEKKAQALEKLLCEDAEKYIG